MTVFRKETPEDRPGLVVPSDICESTSKTGAETPVGLQVGLWSHQFGGLACRGPSEDSAFTLGCSLDVGIP